jgi:hypothetical protein
MFLPSSPPFAFYSTDGIGHELLKGLSRTLSSDIAARNKSIVQYCYMCLVDCTVHRV